MTKQKKPSGRKPRIIKLDDEESQASPTRDFGQSGAATKGGKPRKPRSHHDLSQLTQHSDFEQAMAELDLPPPAPTAKRFSWSGVFLGALAGLLSLGVGLAIDQLVRDLFERQAWLGWVAAALSAIVVIAALAIVIREIWGISRLNTIARLRQRARKIGTGGTPQKAASIVRDLDALYSGRADLAHARSQYELQRTNIVDGEDLISLFETTYLGPLDKEANALVMNSAKRVSVVTAISPRAIVDIFYVLMENTRLIRQISQLYGGRPGAIGFWRLTRNVLGHLAVTGAVAAGDSLMQQFVGHGLAARLSTKLGEGVVNGLLTARIGISAMDQARPLDFQTLPRPGVSEVFKQLTRSLTND